MTRQALNLHQPRFPLRLLIMPDESDRRDTPTIESPPPSETEGERETLPPDPVVEDAAARSHTMLPIAGSPSYFESAARDFAASLVELKATRKEIADGFRSQGEKIDAGNRENAQNYALLRQEFVNFRSLFEAKDRDQDARLAAVTLELAAIRAELTTVREQLETQQRDLIVVNEVLDDLEKRWAERNDAAGSSPTPPATD